MITYELKNTISKLKIKY